MKNRFFFDKKFLGRNHGFVKYRFLSKFHMVVFLAVHFSLDSVEKFRFVNRQNSLDFDLMPRGTHKMNLETLVGSIFSAWVTVSYKCTIMDGFKIVSIGKHCICGAEKYSLEIMGLSIIVRKSNLNNKIVMTPFFRRVYIFYNEIF